MFLSSCFFHFWGGSGGASGPRGPLWTRAPGPGPRALGPRTSGPEPRATEISKQILIMIFSWEVRIIGFAKRCPGLILKKSQGLASPETLMLKSERTEGPPLPGLGPNRIFLVIVGQTESFEKCKGSRQIFGSPGTDGGNATTDNATILSKIDLNQLPNKSNHPI